METKYLSAKALALVSEFALVLYRHNGSIINVDSDDVLMEVADHVEGMTDPALRKIYCRLRREMSRNLLMSLPRQHVELMEQLRANHQ